ncbi:MAG: hypothetical protein CM1200mP29_17290 [Verrucomicrobiota bacterium]|nr:MAG: hypothetical protein CM1200mP29_17290 [Verrucomicrobiota bacterium]
MTKQRHRPAIDKHMPRRLPKRGQCLVHRQVRCPQYIDPVDLRRLDSAMPNSSPSSDRSSLKSDSRFLALNFFESFTSSRARAGQLECVQERNHRRRDHRPGQRAPTCLIHPGNPFATSGQTSRSWVNRSCSISKRTCRG